MNKWYVVLLYESGAIQEGYCENNYENSNEVFNDLMLVGKEIGSGDYNAIYTSDNKDRSLSYRVRDISSITISAEPTKKKIKRKGEYYGGGLSCM